MLGFAKKNPTKQKKIRQIINELNNIHFDLASKEFEDFDVEFAEEIKSAMTEIHISEETLKYGKNLIEMPFPDKTLVVMVKRAEQYFVPTGQTELYAGDKLLVISDDENALKETYSNIGIKNYSYQRNK